MPLNIRVALWLTHILCPRIGAAKSPTPASPMPSPLVPDFISDRDLAAADRAFRHLDDEEYEIVASWAEFCAQQPSTYSHLERCLNK
jgi:hypothetical protein